MTKVAKVIKEEEGGNTSYGALVHNNERCISLLQQQNVFYCEMRDMEIFIGAQKLAIEDHRKRVDELQNELDALNS